jgi:hypothetical protein
MTDGFTNFLFKFLNIFGNIIGQIRILAAVPDLLDRIKIRCIRRQPFHINAAESSLQSFGTAAVYHPAIHNQDKPSRKMRQQFCHKGLKIIGDNVMVTNSKIQFQMPMFRRNRNGRNSRQSVAAVPAIMNGSSSLPSPSSPNSWLKHKAAFIQQNSGFTAFSGFFLYGANRSFAKWLSPVRLVRELCVRAFGNCSPSDSGFARLERDGNKLETSFESPLQHVPMSTSSFCNRKLSGLCLTDTPTFDVACLKVSLADRVSAWVRGLLLRLFCKHRAIAPPNCRKSQPSLQPRGFHRRFSAEPLLALDAAEVPLLFLLVSYIILSANTGSFLYFFKGQ